MSSRPLGVVHGYGLAGAGSNLWTRAVVRALCQTGRDVHLVCQESSPERYDFIGAAVEYDAATAPTLLFRRETPYAGTCTLHRPTLNVLPTYVRPRKKSEYVFYIPDLEDGPIEEYVVRNARLLARLGPEVAGFVVNHTVLCSVAAQRAKEQTGTPYALLPHGSAIEYVVKKDPRMRKAAESALASADAVYALNGEMEGRFRDVFPDVPGLMDKVSRMPVGVDTAQFDPAPRGGRTARIEKLAEQLDGLERGRTPEHRSALLGRLEKATAGDAEPSDTDLYAILHQDEYPSSAPDADAETRLAGFDWDQANVTLYVGRLIAAKGIPAVIAAMPIIAAEVPHARFVIGGTGGLREAMEALVWALATGKRKLARQIVQAGGLLEAGGLDGSADGAPERAPFMLTAAHFDRLEKEGRLDAYFQKAEDHLEPEHVVFGGFMDHGPLSALYAVADVGLFPSVVREASPLVVPEAAASATFPIGVDHGGMGDSLRILGEALPEEARPLLLARYDEYGVEDLAQNAITVMQKPGQYAEALRAAAVARYDWQAIAGDLAKSLEALRTGK